MTGSPMLAQRIEGHHGEYLLFSKEDFDALLEATRSQAESELVAARWGIDDCLDRLKRVDMGRDRFIRTVLKPKRQELERIGAVLSWSSGQRGGGARYLFRATVMSHWLEDNLQQITDGGWPS